MALKIEITREYLTDAINGKIASLKRASNTVTNPLMKDLILKDIAAYSHAINTMSDDTPPKK